MTENSERCCTCTTPEITIKLNKQGPQGLTGPQGEPGFSPVIEVSEETPTSYRLSIQTLEGSYETPNLKANFPLGGYVNQVLVKQSNADGDATWDYIPYATTETTGGLTLATEDDIVVGSDKAITGDILAKVVAGYVDLTSTQTITGAKTFNNNLTIGDGYTLDTYYLNARGGEIQAGGTTVIAKENDDVSIPGYSSLIRVGGNLPLLIKGSSDVVRIWRNGSSHIIVDADNIGDYIPDTVVKTSGNQTISGRKTFNSMVYIGTDDENNPLIETKVSTRYNDGFGWLDTSVNTPILVYSHPYQVAQGVLKIGTSQHNSVITSGGEVNVYSAGKLQLIAPEELTRSDGTNEYTVLDSGNISQDAYIQSLVARIEALES